MLILLKGVGGVLGLDPLNNWQMMEWGCFKPNQPRQNQNGKSIKYEHPPSTPTRVFCLRVTLQVWQQVAGRYNLVMPENITITADGEARRLLAMGDAT